MFLEKWKGKDIIRSLISSNFITYSFHSMDTLLAREFLEKVFLVVYLCLLNVPVCLWVFSTSALYQKVAILEYLLCCHPTAEISGGFLFNRGCAWAKDRNKVGGGWAPTNQPTSKENSLFVQPSLFFPPKKGHRDFHFQHIWMRLGEIFNIIYIIYNNIYNI